MEVYRHFIITLVAALALLQFLEISTSIPGMFLLAYAITIGVLMDLDHFLLARAGSGDWKELENALRDPRSAFSDAEKIFRGDSFSSRARFLSHLAILYLVTGLSLSVSMEIAVFSASIISLHIIADIYAHIRSHGVPGL